MLRSRKNITQMSKKYLLDGIGLTDEGRRRRVMTDVWKVGSFQVLCKERARMGSSIGSCAVEGCHFSSTYCMQFNLLNM